MIQPPMDASELDRLENKKAADRLEQKEIIERILASVAGPRRRDLIRLLDETQGAVTDGMIVEKVYGFGPAYAYNPAIIRRLVSDARTLLEVFWDEDITLSNWTCAIPPSDGGGYRMDWSRRTRGTSATETFWGAHLDAGCRIIVVANELLFYTDREGKFVARFTDMNEEGQSQSAQVKALYEEHREIFDLPFAEFSRMRAMRVYMLAGEVSAREDIRDWFMEQGIRVRHRISSNMAATEVDKTSPILLGNPRINRLIATQLGRAKHLRFQMHPDETGIELKGLTQEEIERITRDFPAKVLGDRIRLIDDQDGDVFAVITRLPSRNGGGPVTIIGSEYTRAVAGAAMALTNERLLQLMLHGVWPDNTAAPSSFQLVVVVRGGSQACGTCGGLPEVIAIERY